MTQRRPLVPKVDTSAGHHLIIHSLYDLQATCSCSRWSLTRTTHPPETDSQLRELAHGEWRLHLRPPSSPFQTSKGVALGIGQVVVMPGHRHPAGGLVIRKEGLWGNVTAFRNDAPVSFSLNPTLDWEGWLMPPAPGVHASMTSTSGVRSSRWPAPSRAT